MASALPSFEEFRSLPHAVTLLGMSGVGKTMLSTALRRDSNWFHYSADYRIGTAHLAEHILDNIKFRIMRTDPFVAGLLRSDSIYINHNISVDNLEPVSTYLGMFGDSESGGLDKATFLERQHQYRDAEIKSMRDVARFLVKAWRIYSCKDFINDASGSLCEIADIDNPSDPVISSLRDNTLILYIRANAKGEEALKRRAESDPKPLFYHPAFIDRHLADQPDDGKGVDRQDFARRLFPLLLEDRKPRYEAFAAKYGFAVDVDDLFPGNGETGKAPTSDEFIRILYDLLGAQSAASEVANTNVSRYLKVCRERAERRGQET
ncbi:MAG: hypothetical protein JJ900_05055 [Rhodospirillales bacterium]|nr:hypothetical protein [Rhodospirillales bacterium]MBO6786199.1 hypothetical protein [Rhodospirillales bacterium]